MSSNCTKTLSWCFKSWRNSWWRIAHCFVDLLQRSCWAHTCFSIAWFCCFKKIPDALTFKGPQLHKSHLLTLSLHSSTQLLLQSHPNNHQISELSAFERTKYPTDISLLNWKPHLILPTTALELVWIIFLAMIWDIEINTINSKKAVTAVIILKSVP